MHHIFSILTTNIHTRPIRHTKLERMKVGPVLEITTLLMEEILHKVIHVVEHMMHMLITILIMETIEVHVIVHVIIHVIVTIKISTKHVIVIVVHHVMRVEHTIFGKHTLITII
jgi:hypothetical protein